MEEDTLEVSGVASTSDGVPTASNETPLTLTTIPLVLFDGVATSSLAFHRLVRFTGHGPGIVDPATLFSKLLSDPMSPAAPTSIQLHV